MDECRVISGTFIYEVKDTKEIHTNEGGSPSEIMLVPEPLQMAYLSSSEILSQLSYISQCLIMKLGQRDGKGNSSLGEA